METALPKGEAVYFLMITLLRPFFFIATLIDHQMFSAFRQDLESFQEFND